MHKLHVENDSQLSGSKKFAFVLVEKGHGPLKHVSSLRNPMQSCKSLTKTLNDVGFSYAIKPKHSQRVII